CSAGTTPRRSPAGSGLRSPGPSAVDTRPMIGGERDRVMCPNDPGGHTRSAGQVDHHVGALGFTLGAERDHQIGLAFIEHLLVADVSRPLAVAIPVGRKALVRHVAAVLCAVTPLLGPQGGDAVGTLRSALDDRHDLDLAVDQKAVQDRVDGFRIGPGTAAADENSHDATSSYPQVGWVMHSLTAATDGRQVATGPCGPPIRASLNRPRCQVTISRTLPRSGWTFSEIGRASCRERV